jgi:hypothetical protein
MDVPSVAHLIDPLGCRIPLAAPRATLGRAADCQVVIADPRASRRHAEIATFSEPSAVTDADASGHGTAGGWVLRDLGSTNGTWLNGRRITTLERLRDGDVIEVGGARFTFRDPDATLESAHFPDLVVDEASGETWLNRCPVRLSVQQRALLLLLWTRRGHACSKDEIAAAVWPNCRGEVYDYQIESLVKRLRAKLEPDPAQPILLLNVPGLGYRLVR